jgi:hypothetical protein
MAVSRRLGAVLRLSSVVVVILALAATVAVATGQVGNMRLLVARAGHTATAQLDGSLVIAGGTGNRGVLKSLEFFDPVSGKSTPGPRLFEARSGHSAIALADGRVLLTGGLSGDNALLASSEIYDAAGGALNLGASMGHARANHTSTLLADGRVLIAGGDAEGMAEIYDPATDRFVDTGRLAVARSGHSAVRLGDGRVLLVGGYDAAGATAEIFDSKTNTFSAVRGGLKTARVQPALKLISDGKVQVYGGDAEITMEVYNPVGYFSSRGHLLRDSSAFRSIMYSPGQAALIAIPSAKGKHYAEDALGPEASEFERSGHTTTEVAARSTMVVVGGFGATGAALDTITELGSCSGTVTTDLTDYSPGQTVVMSGSGWAPGEQITLNLHRDTNEPPDTVLYATADENGDWINSDYVVQEFDLGVTFVLTATGDSGCVAQTTFTDSTSLQSVSVGAQAPNPVTSGNAATYTVAVSFNGAGTTGCSATLSAIGLPAGTATNFTPNPVPGHSTSASTSTLTITAPAGTTPGPYTFTVSANAPNVGGGQGCNGGTVNATATLVVASAVSATTTTVTCPAHVTYTGSALTPCTANVTGAGGFNQSLTVAYSSNTNAGTAIASASFAGDANHAASSDSKTFIIDPAASTTTVTCPAHVTYTGSVLTPCTATVTGDGGLNQSITVTYSNNTNAGTANASASFGGDANHAASSDSKTFVIDPAASTTTVSCPAHVTYTGSALTPCTANVTGAGSLNQSLTVTYSNNTNAGTASASASFGGDANHAASSDSKTFIIDPAASTTTVSCPAHVTYTGAALTPCTATFSTSDGQNGSLSVNYSNNVDAGTATASATYGGDLNHASSSDTKNFTIEPAPSFTAITCPASVTYTGAAQTPCTANATGAGSLNQVLAVTYSNNVDAGTATASASYAGDANHAASSNATTFVIDPAPSVTIVTCPAHVAYTGAAQTPCSATATGAGGLNQVVTVGYSNNVGAGTATASATFAGDANHQGSSDSKTFIIDPASSTTTVTCPAHVTYTGAALTPCSAVATGVGGLNQPLAVTYSNNVGVGSAGASATYAGDANHTGSSGSTTFLIDPVPSFTTVTCPAQVTYTGLAQAPCTAAVTGAGGLNLALAVSYANNVNAGTATASAAYAGDANHFGSSNSASFTITRADASIFVNAYSVTYNGASHAATGSATGVLGESLAGLDLGGTVHTAAGSYTDTWTFIDVTGNYNNATGTVNDVIGKADATIVVTPYDVPFDAMPHTATGTAKGVLGETLAGLNLSGTTHSAAGTYNDTWTFTDVTGNYKNTSGQVTDVIEACMAMTSISSNFNGTSIAAGRYIWFNSNFSVSGSHTTPVAISFTDQTITSGYFSTPVPDSVVILDPAATTATTTFAGGMWTTRVPASGLAGNTLLSGAPYLVPAGGLRGGINPVTWSGVISTGTPGIKLNWAWGAAVYTSFSGDPGQVGVKPVDDNKASAYKNSDHAGTPESFKAFVTGGARGGGGSNYTGSWSGTDGVTPVCTQ